MTRAGAAACGVSPGVGDTQGDTLGSPGPPLVEIISVLEPLRGHVRIARADIAAISVLEPLTTQGAIV